MLVRADGTTANQHSFVFQDSATGTDATYLVHVGNGVADRLQLSATDGDWTVNFGVGNNDVQLGLYLLSGWTSANYTIVEVLGTRAVVNQFANPSAGSGRLRGVDQNSGLTWTASIDYGGGTGNDVVLSYIRLRDKSLLMFK